VSGEKRVTHTLHNAYYYNYLYIFKR